MRNSFRFSCSTRSNLPFDDFFDENLIFVVEKIDVKPIRQIFIDFHREKSIIFL